MSTFLQSSGWEEFQQAAGHLPIRNGNQLYIAQPNPVAPYLLSSRVIFEENSTLPKTKAAFLRIEPENKESLSILEKLAPRPLVPTHAVQPRQTSLVALKTSTDEQMASWSSKHRYNARLAQKQGVLVEITGERGFERFWDLLSATANRQGFRTHSKTYYQKMLTVLAPLGMASLMFAHKDGQDLATLLLITFEDTATYLHGASSEEHKELMAPFLLHGEAMRLAHERGCTTYDLWGTDAVQNAAGKWIFKEGAGSAGVTRFKLGFGGEITNYPGTFDVVLDPIRYSGYTLIRKLQRTNRSFS